MAYAASSAEILRPALVPAAIIFVCFDNYVGPSYCKPKPGGDVPEPEQAEDEAEMDDFVFHDA